MSEIPSELLEDFPFTPHVDAEELPVHDLTPEQLDRLQYLAIVRDGIDNRMNELMASLHEDTDASYHSFVRDAEMLRSASLEFMEHATALVEARATAASITTTDKSEGMAGVVRQLAQKGTRR